jgi:hypothetical protein
MSILWQFRREEPGLDGDLEVPDDPKGLLALLRPLPQDGTVANKLTRTLQARRALLRGRTERRSQ